MGGVVSHETRCRGVRCLLGRADRRIYVYVHVSARGLRLLRRVRAERRRRRPADAAVPGICGQHARRVSRAGGL